MRAEVIVVVVAGASREKHVLAEFAFVLDVVAVLVALLVLAARDALVLQVHTIDQRLAVGRPVAACVLEPAELAVRRERARSLGQVVVAHVDVAVAERVGHLLAAVFARHLVGGLVCGSYAIVNGGEGDRVEAAVVLIFGVDVARNEL